MPAQQLPMCSPFKLVHRKHEWRCLLCCHVRTGTIFLGLWHLVIKQNMLYTLKCIVIGD